MKHIFLVSGLLFSLSLMFVTISCTNDDNADPSQTIIADNVQLGTWRITSFIDSGKDETGQFNGFTFLFGSNGTLTSTNGSVTYTGSWNLNDNSSNDDSLDDLDFNILFNLDNDFEELNEDWHFVSQSANRIELIHVSGGNGGTDYLTFEKS
ncbi:MAG TPA: hypothetical protein VFG10_00765 [Saprospiraceae bacterium]|nr:hypothetical protein [Saprospiraceae bacterium]